MKYRIPIMERTPFVVRRPIVTRGSIVSRVPVYERKPITNIKVSPVGCPLMLAFKDCAGVGYCKPEDEGCQPEIFRLIPVMSQTQDSIIISQLNKLKQEQKFVRIVTDVPLSSEVLFAAAYSPFNIVQFNINLLENKSLKDMKWSLCIAKKCGLYAAIMMYPIIPTVIKLKQVLLLMEEYHAITNYFCLKFFDSGTVMPTSYAHVHNVNGSVVPSHYLTPNGHGGVKCSKEYMDKFLSVINTFVKPRKLNVTVCNDCKCY